MIFSHGFEWQTRDGEVQKSINPDNFCPIQWQRVVIIDDINDTGTTEKEYMTVVMEGMTDNVKYVSLFEKLFSEFSVDIAKELDEEEEKQWIVSMRSGGNEIL